VPGEVYQKLLDILLIDNRIKMKKVIMDLPSQSSSFIEFAQYALLDFTLNLLKPGNFSTKSDERSIFCEVYIPLFKAFGNCLGVLKKLNLENLGLLPVPENQTVAHCLP
jgi:hypothetical protein